MMAYLPCASAAKVASHKLQATSNRITERTSVPILLLCHAKIAQRKLNSSKKV